MKLYNVDTKFFDMKADADKHRKSLKLPPKALIPITINNRGEMVEFLNAILKGAINDPLKDGQTPSPEAKGVGPYRYDREAFKQLPSFMQKDLIKREMYASGK